MMVHIVVTGPGRLGVSPVHSAHNVMLTGSDHLQGALRHTARDHSVENTLIGQKSKIFPQKAPLLAARHIGSQQLLFSQVGPVCVIFLIHFFFH